MLMRIWFWVNVPVLSVQITVQAPIVSQACIFRTRLLASSIRFMLRANDRDTLIGRPSGTVTTMTVTAIMKVLSSSEATLSQVNWVAGCRKNIESRPITMRAAMT